MSGIRVAERDAGVGDPRVRRVEFTSSHDGTPQWALESLPTRGRDWVVVIHGHGSRGDQLYTRPDLRDTWLPFLREIGVGVLTPDLRGNGWMGPAAYADCAALIERLRSAHGAGRVLLASGSMGGTSSLIYAALRPFDVEGVVALCPATDLASYHAWASAPGRASVCAEIARAIELAYGGAPHEVPTAYAAHSARAHVSSLRMPVWIAHGDADAIIPVEQSRSIAPWLDLRLSRYREVAGGDHDAPLALFGEALRWVLARAEPRGPHARRRPPAH